MRGAALITGAARRIGRELALEAARLGYDVAIHHRDAVEDAAKLGQEISGLGRRSLLLHADLADESEVATLVSQATDALGPVTLLVNNASLFQDDRLPSMTRASWDAHMSVNLRAPIVLLQSWCAGSRTFNSTRIRC